MSKKLREDLVEDDLDFDFADDDGEAAFWDEFFYTQERMDLAQEDRSYTVKIIDEATGEESSFEGIRIRKKPVVVD